jgi:inner membrane protein
MNEWKVPGITEALAFLKRCATIFKMAGVAVLILLLLVPLSMVRSVLRERLGRRNDAVADITSSWGRDQKLAGPVLIVPYRYAAKSWKEQPTASGRIEKVEVVDMVTANAYFLPTNLTVSGDIKPMQLRRGIYLAVVYTGKLEFAGEFARPDFARLRIKPEEVMWDDALVAFAIPDLRGVKETLNLQWGEKSHPLLPGSKLGGFQSGVQSGVFAAVGDLRGGEAPIPFRLALSLNGSGGLSFAPLGSQSTVRLMSSWPDPSFFGAFLPTERKVTRDGFEATWQVSYYGRNFPQQWTSQTPEPCLTPSGVESSLFGVNFLSGIDAYRNTERAIKYGALFIVLIFAAFFLFEMLAALRIHPFQYAIVGVALCLFYLGLLSLSEFIPFGLAYLVAAGATTLLICFHSAKMLKSGGRTFIIAGLLAGIYGFLYVALQLQDYALLLGTGGLFAVLAFVIWFTRNIDWYARDRA